TSLAIESSGVIDRDPVLRAVLRELARRYRAWLAEGPGSDATRNSYVRRCSTLGRAVRVRIRTEQTIEGVAEDIDELGQLVVLTKDGPRVVGAGDVIHVR